MITLKELRAEAKRALGPRGLVEGNSYACRAYRQFHSRKHAPFIEITVHAKNQDEARSVLMRALKGQPDFEGEPDMEIWR